MYEVFGFKKLIFHWGISFLLAFHESGITGRIMTDVRIYKTKAKLKSSVLDLLKTKSISNITVTELCKAAKINRNTFYAYYDSPDMLLTQIQNTLYQELLVALNREDLNNIDIGSFLYSILSVIHDNKDICAVLFGEYGDIDFIESAIAIPKSTAMRVWREKQNISEFEANLRYSYFSGGAISVIRDWVESGYQADLKAICDCLKKLISL